jgi:hypothetical protein
MTSAPVELIEEVLRRTLGPYGFDHAEVRVAPDHAGDEALFIDAVLKPKSGLVGGKVSNEAHGALSDALLAHGDRRFPYMSIRHPDDEPAELPSMPADSDAP